MPERVEIERFEGDLRELGSFIRMSTLFEEEAAVERAIVIEEARGTRYYVARADGRVVGILGLYIDEVWEMRTLYPPEVIDVAVLSEFRGKGVGRALLAFAIDQARETDADYLWVMTGAESDANHTFYRSCGFKLAAVVPDQMGKGYGKAWFRFCLKDGRAVE